MDLYTVFVDFTKDFDMLDYAGKGWLSKMFLLKWSASSIMA